MTDQLRILVGSDSAGADYKDAIAADLRSNPHVAVLTDLGVHPDDPGAKTYPSVAIEAATRIASGEADRAILFCGTGSVSRSQPTRCRGSGPRSRTTRSAWSARSCRTTARSSPWGSGSSDYSSRVASRPSG